MGVGRYELMRWTVAGIALAAVLHTPQSVEAQELSAQERQAAAEAAYDRGSAAYRGGDYETAARWYETANELAPSAPALIQAIRSHERAGSTLRAATLALELVDRYGEERMGPRASPIVERATEEGVRVDITCGEGCELVVDGENEARRELFLGPDTEHLIIARFPTGEVREHVLGRPGERRELTFTPPEPEATPEPAPAGPVSAQPEPALQVGIGAGGEDAVQDEGGGLGPGFFIAGAVMTAAAGGFLIWSGLDTLSAADDYEQMPTRAKLENGRDLELRTNLLIGATAGLATVTLVFALFTDWSGDDSGASAAVLPLPEGGLALAARGSLP